MSVSLSFQAVEDHLGEFLPASEEYGLVVLSFTLNGCSYSSSVSSFQNLPHISWVFVQRVFQTRILNRYSKDIIMNVRMHEVRLQRKLDVRYFKYTTFNLTLHVDTKSNFLRWKIHSCLSMKNVRILILKTSTYTTLRVGVHEQQFLCIQNQSRWP